MRAFSFILAIILFTLDSLLSSRIGVNSNSDLVTDNDGHTYHTVAIGTQVWMVENLKTTHYRNGDPIAVVIDHTEWSQLITGASCHFNHDSTKGEVYGRLYNWYAVADKRNMCPPGWHVPTREEWQQLINFLGGEFVAGGKLKEAGIAHWASPNIEATNTSGFAALPAGSRDNGNGRFNHSGTYTYFWSATESHGSAWGFNLSFYYAGIGQFEFDKSFGISVRCIKD